MFESKPYRRTTYLVSKRTPFATPLDVKTPLRWTSTLDVKSGEITIYRIQPRVTRLVLHPYIRTTWTKVWDKSNRARGWNPGQQPSSRCVMLSGDYLSLRVYRPNCWVWDTNLR